MSEPSVLEQLEAALQPPGGAAEKPVAEKPPAAPTPAEAEKPASPLQALPRYQRDFNKKTEGARQEMLKHNLPEALRQLAENYWPKPFTTTAPVPSTEESLRDELANFYRLLHHLKQLAELGPAISCLTTENAELREQLKKAQKEAEEQGRAASALLQRVIELKQHVARLQK